MPSAHQFSYTVAPRESGLRLDVFLLSRLRLDFPERVFFRAEVISCLRETEVLVSGKRGKPSTTVSLDDVVSGEWRERTPRVDRKSSLSELVPQVLFENEHFRVLEKPAGLQVHPSEKCEPSTVLSWLQKEFPGECVLLGEENRFGIVHRLDKETSGLLLVARTHEAFESLKSLFHDRLVEKTYHALAFGHFALKQGSIEGDIISGEHSLKRRVASLRDSLKKRVARTDYEVEKRFRDFDLVKVFPKTGRTHQIRVHFLSMGHPIVGDKLYGHRLTKRLALESFVPKRHLLHASQLRFMLFGYQMPTVFWDCC
jgi:23S rRNA pseudouridine1911/1915/1917 synthase